MKLLKNFPNDSTIIPFHKQLIGVVVAPHSHQHFILSVFPNFHLSTRCAISHPETSVSHYIHLPFTSVPPACWLISAIQSVKGKREHEGQTVSYKYVIQKIHLSFPRPVYRADLGCKATWCSE